MALKGRLQFGVQKLIMFIGKLVLWEVCVNVLFAMFILVDVQFWK